MKEEMFLSGAVVLFFIAFLIWVIKENHQTRKIFKEFQAEIQLLISINLFLGKEVLSVKEAGRVSVDSLKKHKKYLENMYYQAFFMHRELEKIAPLLKELKKLKKNKEIIKEILYAAASQDNKTIFSLIIESLKNSDKKSQLFLDFSADVIKRHPRKEKIIFLFKRFSLSQRLSGDAGKELNKFIKLLEK